jgi:adenine phosphoribosyltransferase
VNTKLITDCIRDIPDFPKPGIVFKDITPVLQNPEAYRAFIDLLIAEYRDKNLDAVVAVDARGFLFGGALAYELGIGLVPVRKKGKLPSLTHEVSYDLEYGSATLEIHEDALKPGARVVILDDLLATGGTVAATLQLCEALGAEVVGCAFMVELSFLGGRERLGDVPVFVPVVV